MHAVHLTLPLEIAAVFMQMLKKNLFVGPSEVSFVFNN